MKKITIFILAGLVLGILSACEMETEQPKQQVRTVNVETEQVEPGVFESYLRQVGTVTTKRDVQVASEVSGRIVAVHKDEGEHVNAGETVVKVDDRSLRQELQRLEAVTAQSRENYERLKRLYEDENIGSEIDYLNAKYTYDQNKAALESVRINLDNTSITAPFTGSVESIFTEVGELVTPATPVFRIISQGEKEVRLGVPARYSGAVDLGDMAEVWFDFDSDKRYQLPISFIGNSIEPTNRTFTVEINLPSDLDHVKIDMIANVRLLTERLENVIKVGEEYVFQKEGSNVVYVVNQDDNGHSVANERVVELGSTYANEVVVKNGLNAGEQLITLGASYVEDGTRIEMVDQLQSEMVLSKEN